MSEIAKTTAEGHFSTPVDSIPVVVSLQAKVDTTPVKIISLYQLPIRE